MNRYTKSRVVTISHILAAILLIVGCASTRLVSSWSEPGYQGKIQKILILGMSKNDSIKSTYESTMTAAFQKAGVQAEEARSMIPAGNSANREAIKSALASKGFDSILVTRMVSKREETYFVPDRAYSVSYPYYNRFYDYYFHVYPAVYGPGYLATDTIVNLESNIYEIKEGKLIWSAISETINPKDIQKEVGALSELFVNQLKKDGLITS